MKLFFACCIAVVLAASCQKQQIDAVDDNPVGSFAKGADIGWLTEMEDDGMKFYNDNGDEQECIALLKEHGMNAVRYRVWVNPTAGYSNIDDVVAKSVRAKKLNQRIMIDFHYSDYFADPGRQTKPADWQAYSYEQILEAIAEHTTTSLQALKDQGIEPEWVQVGNETRNGMIWDDGKLWDDTQDLNNWHRYAEMTNAGYDAVKAVFPNAIVIVHIDNGWEDNDWWFKKYTQNGGKMDMIGLSHYPQTHASKGWKEMNTLCLNHIKSLAATYKCKVMVAEIGTKANNPSIAKSVMVDFMTQAREIEACAGVFYWEPQVYGGWKPEAYNDLGWGAYDMGAFTSKGQVADTLKELFK